jgi:hypothetical protein
MARDKHPKISTALNQKECPDVFYSIENVQPAVFYLTIYVCPYMNISMLL